MANNNNGPRVPAQTIGELDVHISYLQGSVKEVAERLAGMATKEDIEAISSRLTEFATKQELKTLESRVDDISPKHMADSATRYLTLFVVFCTAIGAVYALVNWIKP